MNFIELNPPVIELPETQSWHRVQRTKAIRGSVRVNGHILPPTGLLTGRFDLPDEPVSYVADSEDTALYEAVFRREIHSYPLERLRERSLVTFQATGRLRVAGVRGLEEQHPVLQSARYVITREFALDCRDRGLDGILYASAQHANHGCVCLFEAGIRKLRRSKATPLVKPGTDQLHRAVVRTSHGSRVPIDATT
ncbi:RES family NAD+ phosphorylase [Variovorax sp. JS1663]|uniref:RES family NAD+ phosphorylase n=1 Tax=Variovorax sp. JS1663 TaxID=1851577 RepID=UPI000B3487FA|nr:RES family NAD+ phosphorylase [Variovorax sp. JS1663]OUM00040.1 hypothetical protein A8M77_22915 [Variovorax sp. JS1663]